MSKLKIGIIGTGGISHEHIQAYVKSPYVELYAFCDIDVAKVKAVGEKYGVSKTFTDVHKMLELKEIDAVSVCTWNSEHASCVIAALKAGKHVLCEKPMAISAQQAREMKDVADATGKLLMIGFVRRFGNDCIVLKDFINSDFFGEIYYAKATYLRRNGNPGGWFGDKSRSAGGPLIDLGVHVTDLVRYLLGNPKPISVYGATFQKLLNRPHIKGVKGYVSTTKTNEVICDVEDLATAMIRFDNGAVLQIEASFSLNIKADEGKIELFGTKGGAKINPEIEMYTETNGYLTNVSLDNPTALQFNDLFKNEMDHFIDCIINKVPCRAPAEDGIVIMSILDAVYESAKTGHEVIL